MTVRGAAMGSERKQHCGTQEDPLPVTSQFINGRGPNEVCVHHCRLSISQTGALNKGCTCAILQCGPRRV